MTIKELKDCRHIQLQITTGGTGEMRLIDADELKRQFNNSGVGEAVKSVIDDAPTITTGPVRLGQWIDHRNGIKCSRCGRSLELQYTDGVSVSWMEHCPNCGVEMV